MDLIKKNKKETKNGDWGVLCVWVDILPTSIKKRSKAGFMCALVTLKWGGRRDIERGLGSYWGLSSER